MSMKLFLDADIILDVIFKREPHFIDSQKVMSLVERDLFHGYTSSLIIANCYYIISSNKDQKTAIKAITKLRSVLTILPFTDKEIGESLSSDIKDFEDGIQYFICINNNIDYLVTRNIADYKDMEINALTPKDFLNLEEAKKIIEVSDNNNNHKKL
ncbi:MAG: PIN domain-containing protein [Actinobacteria bacterium]|nr:PIN domain-containing protein [Actinomycetota bacterium]